MISTAVKLDKSPRSKVLLMFHRRHVKKEISISHLLSTIIPVILPLLLLALPLLISLLLLLRANSFYGNRHLFGAPSLGGRFVWSGRWNLTGWKLERIERRVLEHKLLAGRTLTSEIMFEEANAYLLTRKLLQNCFKIGTWLDINWIKTAADNDLTRKV